MTRRRSGQTASGTSTGRRGASRRTERLSGPPDAPFELRYPAGWRKVPRGDLQQTESRPLAAVRRPDGRGLVTVSMRGPVTVPLEQLRTDFQRALAERFADFELHRSELMRVRAGDAMYTSWLLRSQDRVQGNLTVPVGERTYTLDATVAVGAADVAREVGTIFAGFDVRAD